MRAEELQAHVKEAADGAVADDIGAIQVQEDGPQGQHLAAVVAPDVQHLPQKGHGVHGSLLDQLGHLTRDVGIAFLSQGGAKAQCRIPLPCPNPLKLGQKSAVGFSVLELETTKVLITNLKEAKLALPSEVSEDRSNRSEQDMVAKPPAS